MIDLIRDLVDLQRNANTGIVQLQDQLAVQGLLMQALIDTHPAPDQFGLAVQRLLAARPDVQAARLRMKSATPPD